MEALMLLLRLNAGIPSVEVCKDWLALLVAQKAGRASLAVVDASPLIKTIYLRGETPVVAQKADEVSHTAETAG
jgi:hypothetical protein